MGPRGGRRRWHREGRDEARHIGGRLSDRRGPSARAEIVRANKKIKKEARPLGPRRTRGTRARRCRPSRRRRRRPPRRPRAGPGRRSWSSRRRAPSGPGPKSLWPLQSWPI